MAIDNITLHYILLPAADTINRAVIFKRFIDDIVWLSYDLDTTNEIQNLVSFTFEENKLEVLFLGFVQKKINNNHAWNSLM